MVSVEGIHMDESKIKEIRDWPTPRSITKVHNFQWLAVFQYYPDHQLFIKKEELWVNRSDREAFQGDQSHAYSVLLNFSKIFEVECDDYSEKFDDVKQRWSTYEQELYAVVRILKA